MYRTSINIFNSKAVLFFITLLFPIFCFAQKKGKNLVPNPSFETHRNKANVIKNAIPWLNVATVDYYIKPDKKDTSRYKGARTGTCYAGLRFQPDYKEYMYVRLNETLEKGKTYRFRMYVRLLGSSTVSVKQLGVYFSDDAFKMGMAFDEEGMVDSTYKKGLSGAGWLPIKGNYVAHGGEKYIIIGNFREKMKDDFVKKNKWDLFESREAYYYVDDVSLRRIYTAADTVNVKNPAEMLPVYPDSFSTGQVVEIKNVEFEIGNAKLLQNSHKMLDELVETLNENPFMEIQINVYADDLLNESSNRKLSKRRAKAIYNYLKEEQVINPMKYKGMGPSPVAVAEQDKNKRKKNRMEFVVIKLDTTTK